MCLILTNESFSNVLMPIKADSSVNIAELESTVVFLEDSQRVNSLASQLKMIINARKAVSDNSIKSREVNFLQIIKMLKAQIRISLNNFKNQISELPDSISSIKTSVSENTNHYYVFFLIFSIAISTGLLVGFLLRRLGFILRKNADISLGVSQKIVALCSYFLIKNIFTFSLIIAGLLLLIIPSGLDIDSTVYRIIIGLLVYSVAVGITHWFWNPESNKYRIFSTSNEYASQIVKHTIRILRFSLWVFILYSICQQYLPFISIILSGFYKLTSIVWIPRLFAIYQNKLSSKFVDVARRTDVLPRSIITTAEFIINKLSVLSLIFFIGISMAWFLGLNDAYLYILKASLKTIVVGGVSILNLLLWGMLMTNAKRSLERLSSDYSDLKSFFSSNLVLFRRAGSMAIVFVFSISVLHFWGMSLGKLIQSDNSILESAIHIILILFGSFLLVQIAIFAIEKLKKEAASRMISSNLSSGIEVEKRVATLGNVSRKISISTIIVFAVIMVLDELGLDVKAMLAGIGIIGLAVGFGAQNLVRDIISGLLLIFENRIRVGDVAIINGTSGYVEQVNLRTTVLRGADGTIHVFANGAINSLSNMTHEFSCYVFDVGVNYNTDLDKAVSVLKRVGEEIMEDPEYKKYILEPIEVLGVDSFKEFTIIIKARIKTLPIKQWVIGREINKRIKKCFDDEGIEMSIPHRKLYFGDSEKPLALRIEGTSADREMLKEIVREVMMEKEEEASR